MSSGELLNKAAVRGVLMSMRAVGWELKKARNLFTEILRGPSYDDASCLAFVVGFISLFLWQVEPLLWRRGIFRVLEGYEGQWPGELKGFSNFWLFPFEWVPPELRHSLWIPAAAVYLVNAVLSDRFVARHGGGDVSFRRPILILRRLVGGLPLLGLCVFPLWRILDNRKSAWGCRSATPPRLIFEGPDPARRLHRGGAELHSTGFFVWLVTSHFFALRAALTWLNEPERATVAGLLAVQAICGSLRIGGALCTVAYVSLRGRDGALWGKRKWALLLSAGAWFLPQSAFLLGVLAIVHIGERWGTVMEDVKARATQERDEGTLFSAIGRAFHTVSLDRATHKVLRLYREKTFLLMTEVASVMMLVVPARERLPWLNLPGCLMALLYLVTLLTMPIGAVLYLRSLFSAISGPAERTRSRMEHPFARYLLLTSMAVVVGFNIGVLAGARELGTLGTFFFWIGAYGTTAGFAAAFWGLIRRNESLLLLIWPMLFAMIGMTGYEMQHGSPRLLELGIGPGIEDVANFHLFKLYLMIPLVFLLTVFAGLYRCRWLVRPFRVRDIFNPTLPKPLRRRLVFLVSTACLPLGGFLVPAWIRIRSSLTLDEPARPGE